MTNLTLALGLVLPAVETVVQRIAFIGTTGSGKTYAAMKLAEQMWWAGQSFVALDVMGIWYGLRVPASQDENDGPLGDVFIFGGRHGDVSITDDDGALVAETIYARDLSAVVDLSELDTNAAKARFAAAFAKRIYDLHKAKPRALHLFLEEAHEYLPQNPDRGEQQMLSHWNRLWKQGRNFGLGGSLITQRPQDINPKARELSGCVFAFNTTGTNAVDAMQKWMGKAETQGIQQLQPGECIVWSASWLKINERVKIGKRQTAHVSFDPLNPQAAPSPDDTLPLPREDMAEIRAAFEKPKEEEAETSTKPGRKSADFITQADVDQAIAQATERFTVRIAKLEEERDVLRGALNRLRFQITESLAQALDTTGVVQIPIPRVETAKTERPPAPKPEVGVLDVPDARYDYEAAELRIIDTLATFATIGLNVVTRDTLALFCGISPTTKSHTYALSRLLKDGLLSIPSSGRVSLTVLGANLALADDQPPTLAALHEKWVARLRGKHKMAEVLEAMLQHGLDPVRRLTIADELGLSMTTKSLTYAFSGLLDLGVIRVAGIGFVQITDLLFPEGLS